LRDHFNIKDSGTKEGYMFNFEGHEIIDFGDDKYTKGRPHPMIDPGTRIDAISKLMDRDDVAVVLFDNVLGYGSNTDMAESLAPSIKKVIKHKKAQNKEIVFIASVCGTESDIQTYSSQVKKLEDAGVLVLKTNAEAVFTAIEALKYIESNTKTDLSNIEKETLLNSELKVINIGLESFADTILKHEGKVVQYNWAPIAGGDKKIQSLLDKLNSL
jgi:FdrA protein